MRRVTAGMVGFVGLTLEIAYTRIVSFKLWYYYTYLVIGLSLLGIGSGGGVASTVSAPAGSSSVASWLASSDTGM